MKRRQITVFREDGYRTTGDGVLVPLDAKVVSVSLDTMGEHASVVYYLEREVEIDDDAPEDAEEA